MHVFGKTPSCGLFLTCKRKANIRNDSRKIYRYKNGS
jgi:hypothetical protein